MPLISQSYQYDFPGTNLGGRNNIPPPLFLTIKIRNALKMHEKSYKYSDGMLTDPLSAPSPPFLKCVDSVLNILDETTISIEGTAAAWRH